MTLCITPALGTPFKPSVSTMRAARQQRVVDSATMRAVGPVDSLYITPALLSFARQAPIKLSPKNPF
jgi:hypothetical protein